MTNAELIAQFRRMAAAGWLRFFEHAAKAYELPVPLLLAIASRETNCRNILGDGGHGHGIMQIDDRSFPAWCGSGRWMDAQEAIRMGAWVFSKKLYAISPAVPAHDRMSVAAAAYNCGAPKAVANYLAGNVDRGTTGRDYSKDVFARERVFAELYHAHNL